MKHSLKQLLIVFVVCCGTPIANSSADDALPPFIQKFLSQNCTDCHSGNSADANLDLELSEIDWSNRETIAIWESIHKMVSKQIMPPQDSTSPTKKKRDAFLSWLDKTLIKESPIGGTTLRRLSRREYEKTIQTVFGLPTFKLPNSFPPDNESHGFNNQGEALVVAASHLEAFSETAALVADEFFAPTRKPADATEFKIPGKDLVISYSSACFVDGAMRLASSGSNITRNATWPMRFAAPSRGTYKIEITASVKGTPAVKPILDVSTMDVDQRNIAAGIQLEIQFGNPQTFLIELDLNRGQTVVFRYPNGPYDYEDKKKLPVFLKHLFVDDPRLAAAWKKIGNVPRGGNGWARLQKTMKDPELMVLEYAVDDADLVKLAKSVASNAVKTGETLVYKYFEEGPNIGIHNVRITGPHEIFPDHTDVRIARQRKKLMGKFDGKSDVQSLRVFFKQFLTTALRRPATETEIAAYTGLVQREIERGTGISDATAPNHDSKALNEAMHLAIRTALISPSFLYRSIVPGKLNDHELASRLSYFLTSGPPTTKLRNVADAGRLSKSDILTKEARRLINVDFAEAFTRQWLGLEKLDNLMPDARLIRKFTPNHRRMMQLEVRETFHHILENNLRVTEFIAPDFVFTDPVVGYDIYGFKQFKPVSKNNRKNTNATSFKKGIQRVEVPRDGRAGGLLSMPAIMMATANGVDTQPVLRGVWMLENILGSPVPEPPNAVPALTPDTSGAKSPKERLAAHMASQNCAVCHREIDPLGFVLENYDPIGRWRTNYPKFIEDEEGGKSKLVHGLAIDTSGTLPCGTKLNDVTDLKTFLSKNPEPFARCISEKLMTYATGRKLNYRERALIAEIVSEQARHDLRFRDLLLALVNSEIFRTK
ncbi:MAG: hypothetical protein ACI87E_003710 [Mariniblastus sp.]